MIWSMTDLGGAQADRLPRSAWVFAWLCLAGGLLQLLLRGLSESDPIWVVLSAALSAVVVRWFASGVLQARTARLVVVWVLLCLVVLLGVVGTRSDADVPGLLDLLVSVAEVIALGVFCATPYFRRQRTPPAPRADLGAVLAIAVVVGVLGGATAPAVGDNPPHQLRISL
jgi:glucose dehydrogenase